MSKERAYISLSNKVNSRNINVLSSFLTEHSDLDVTHEEGALIISAVTNDTRYGGITTTKLLLNYYETVQLPALKTSAVEERELLRLHLKSALEIAIEGETLSSEMTALLGPYILDPTEHSSTLSADSSSSIYQDISHIYTANTNIQSDLSSMSLDSTQDTVHDSEASDYSSQQDRADIAEHEEEQEEEHENDKCSALTTKALSAVQESHESVILSWDVNNRPQAIRLRQIGDKYRKAGDLKKAENCYQESIEYDSKYCVAYRQLGKLYQLQERDIEAIDAYVKAIVYKRSNTSYDDVYRDLSNLVHSHRTESELASKVDELRDLAQHNPSLCKIFSDISTQPNWQTALYTTEDRTSNHGEGDITLTTDAIKILQILGDVHDNHTAESV